MTITKSACPDRIHGVADFWLSHTGKEGGKEGGKDGGKEGGGKEGGGGVDGGGDAKLRSAILIPRVRQPGVVPFDRWCQRYAYLLNCITRCIWMRLGTAHGSLVFDWDGIHRDLVKYLYKTSANRYAKFDLLK